MNQPKQARRKNSKKMKGRPITEHEFNRMLKQTPIVRGGYSAPSWERFMRGLWLSGLRLGEAIDLHWDRSDKLSVDISDPCNPLFVLIGEDQKNGEDDDCPMAPEFAEFLFQTPEHERTGKVFKLTGKNPGTTATDDIYISQQITLMGEKAKVIVSTNPRNGKIKYASAHDFRRSFGQRMAYTIAPAVLQRIMRHAEIETTMLYYAQLDSERISDMLFEAELSNTSSNSGSEKALGNRDLNPN